MKAEVSEHRDCRYFNLEPFRARPSPSDCTAPTPALAQTHTLLAIRCIHNHDPTPVQSGPAPPGPVPRRHWEGAGGSFSLLPVVPVSPVLWQDRLTDAAGQCLPARPGEVWSALRTCHPQWKLASASSTSGPCRALLTTVHAVHLTLDPSNTTHVIRPVPVLVPVTGHGLSGPQSFSHPILSRWLLLFSLCRRRLGSFALPPLLPYHLTSRLLIRLLPTTPKTLKAQGCSAARLRPVTSSLLLLFLPILLTIPTTPSPFLLPTTTYSDPPRPPVSHDHELPHDHA
ncbi:hypothetical protein CSIM01_07168 [Colletotrichum simmondsii]|uniref:Uncharacterized protein n=1 Tax=Colletotrichum simmondsii TaxID=703756 RepID=A0A135SE36_9PEZI|nr:hypothetical protein CSIM01_07168 [Colletotrichum simmondsii]